MIGNAADGELDVLPLARVEAAQEDLLGVALAALVGEQDAGRELEQLGRVLACGPGRARRPSIWKSEAPRLGGGRRPWTVTSSAAGGAGASDLRGGGGGAAGGLGGAGADSRRGRRFGDWRGGLEVEQKLDATRDGRPVA